MITDSSAQARIRGETDMTGGLDLAGAIHELCSLGPIAEEIGAGGTERFRP